jgi:ribosomal protein L11 methylase PrmA
VAAAQANALRNGAEITAEVRDLGREPAPRAAGFAANLPARVHLVIADGWREGETPVAGLVSGFGSRQAQAVADAYAAAGLHERRRHALHGWVVAELARG